jgi:hypothetical protein
LMDTLYQIPDISARLNLISMVFTLNVGTYVSGSSRLLLHKAKQPQRSELLCRSVSVPYTLTDA